ncbi:tumor necrosis factor alpha-induced 8-like [Brachionus plicatilis]|uniref:Tumor necrosis factor alpha-induced 8-like n=1 Tax=Brachionus plicatilis TaxID=10195 RepID=A0A3M7Q0A0_BRAPC|nr:tumor necrosis factor alpha-induced 8-like [Brachionus plicatilis]
MDDENNNSTLGSGPMSAQSLALRIQKKVASKMSNKNMAKIFIDETSGRLLDSLYKLVKEYSANKKLAESILNDIIKVIVKIGILVKNEQLSSDEIKNCDNFRQSFHLLTKSALSFYEIEYTFDLKHLQKLLMSCKSYMHDIIRGHLTDKSKNRVDNVFNFFSESKFLEEIFRNAKYSSIMKAIFEDARKLVDEGLL